VTIILDELTLGAATAAADRIREAFVLNTEEVIE